MTEKSNQQNNFDVVAFTLAGNTLIALVRKGMLSIAEAKEVIRITYNTHDIADELRNNTEIDIRWHLDNLTASLESAAQKD